MARAAGGNAQAVTGAGLARGLHVAGASLYALRPIEARPAHARAIDALTVPIRCTGGRAVDGRAVGAVVAAPTGLADATALYAVATERRRAIVRARKQVLGPLARQSGEAAQARALA